MCHDPPKITKMPLKTRLCSELSHFSDRGGALHFPPKYAPEADYVEV